MSRDVFIHPGTPVHGYACPDCERLTVIVIPYFWITTDGVTTAPANVVCTNCHRHFTHLGGGHDGPQ